MPDAPGTRPVDQLDLDAVREGAVTMQDVMISGSTLAHQADLAENAGNPQLGENLRRAAEMRALSDVELLQIYEALRPGRSTPDELESLAADLHDRDMPRCSRLVREAADVYTTCGLAR